MEKNYKEITDNIKKGMGDLRTEIPEVLQQFNGLGSAATKDAVLSHKVKEFIALALGVASQCDGCIGFHTQALARLGATREEVAEVLGVCVYMGGGPNLMYASEAIQAFDEALAAG